jgi:hypothetical protein
MAQLVRALQNQVQNLPTNPVTPPPQSQSQHFCSLSNVKDVFGCTFVVSCEELTSVAASVPQAFGISYFRNFGCEREFQMEMEL